MRRPAFLPAFRAALFALSVPLALSGCAGRDPLAAAPILPAAALPGQEAAPGMAASALSFSDQVAALPEGSTRSLAESPFGPASIDAGPAYRSGLGEECRSARAARNGETTLFAVCRDAGGVWRFIPTIFEDMPR